MRSLRSQGLVLLLAVGLAAVAAACGGGGGGSTTSSGTHAGGSGSTSTGDGGTLLTSTGPSAVLSITPANPILDVTGAPGTLQLSAALSDGGDPGKITWDLADVVVGTVSSGGLFTSPGFTAGSVEVTASALGLTAKTTVTVRVHITDDQAGLSDPDKATLRAGGAADPSFRWLYPYDATVFPRGLRSPNLQLQGNADATYVKLAVGDYLYEGFFGAASPVQIALPQAAWQGLTQSAGAKDKVSAQVTKLSAGQATGPATASWTVAPGSFKGVIYYNTYLSSLTSTGAVMRVRPNVDAEVFIGRCTVCHSVSANGNVIASGLDWADGNPIDSGTFDVAADGTQAARYTDGDGRKLAFAGLTPNGEMAVGSGVPASGSPIRGLSNPLQSLLYDTRTGAPIDAPSLTSAVTYAITPAFSPDATRLAFNFWDQGAGKTLGVLDVDLKQTPPLFGNLRAVATAGRNIAGWPSFLPDAKAVLYHDGDAFDTGNAGGAQYAEIRLADIATQTVSSLAALNGRRADGSVYLPYGEAEEANLDYEPNVLPIPVGGYYWVVFTSRRAYGNTIAVGGTVPGGDNKWGTNNGGEVPSMRKKLWVAAVDLDYTGKIDPSHPAFYLGEQELQAGNMRAFVSLEPCRGDGSTCESAAECCNGFCRPNGALDADGKPVTACVPPPGGCSLTDESCQTAADCCGTTDTCINGRCALAPPG